MDWKNITLQLTNKEIELDGPHKDGTLQFCINDGAWDYAGCKAELMDVYLSLSREDCQKLGEALLHFANTGEIPVSASTD